MQLSRLDPHAASVASRWYEAFRAGGVAGREAPTFFAETSVLGSLRTSKTRLAFGAWEGEVCLGAALVALPPDGIAEIELNVPPAHRNRGIGGALFESASRLAEHFSTEINVPLGQTLATHPGGRFALARGIRAVLAEQRYLLDLPGPAVVVAPRPGYTIEAWAGPVSPDRAAVFAEMRTLMEQDVPTGERTVTPAVFSAEQVLRSDERLAAQGWGLLTALVLDAGGTPAGYTRIFVNADGVHAQQDDTFVRRAHRGKGLGALAKSANLRQLGALHPMVRHLHSWTADGNDAMIAVNARFGFRPVEAMHVVES